jgi:hypothetical protein
VQLTFEFPSDGNTVLLMDLEGIDYLKEGIEDLRNLPPGSEVSSPGLSEDGVSEIILRRA